MPERKADYLLGGCLTSYKELLAGSFQRAYDNCASKGVNVRVPRGHVDVPRMMGLGISL